MAKCRALFCLVSLVAWATRVDTRIFAQTQTTDKRRKIRPASKFYTQEIAATCRETQLP
jgi:hypothetical protein